MGVSRQTAYKWLRRFRDEGVAGLEDRSSAPWRCPHRLSAEAVESIVAARLDTLHGPHRLAYGLGRPRSTIYGVLRRAGISRLGFIDRPTRTVVRYERERPGELLHIDVKKLGRIRDGGGWKLKGQEIRGDQNRHRKASVGSIPASLYRPSIRQDGGPSSRRADQSGSRPGRCCPSPAVGITLAKSQTDSRVGGGRIGALRSVLHGRRPRCPVLAIESDSNPPR